MTSKLTPDDRETRMLADRMIFQAMEAMNAHGVPFAVMIDRLLIATAAQIANRDGGEHAAATFRGIAENIDKGALVAVERRTRAN